jgi:alpha-1,2-mannosyltransferase
VLVGLATGVKLVPGLFIVHALFIRRRMAVVAAAATLLTFVVLPGLSLNYWLHRVRQGDRVGSTDSLANQSLRGVVARIDPGHANLLWAVGAVIVATVTIALAVRAWRAGHPLASLAIVGLTNALVSPFAWFAHFCWIVVALGVVVGDGRDRRRLAVAAGTWLLLNLDPVYRSAALVDGGRLPTAVGAVLEQSLFLAALVLIGTLAWIARTPPAEDPVSASVSFRTAAG